MNRPKLLPTPLPPAQGGRSAARGGFTLVEIMVVIGIMGLVLGIGIPAFFHALHRNPIQQATRDIQDACQNARMMAIMQGVPAEIVITEPDQISVRPASQVSELDPDGGAPGLGAGWAAGAEQGPPRTPIKGFSARLPPSIAFKRLLVNLRETMDGDEPRVRFYPNGTCDQFVVTLLSDQNEERTITLEITTGRERLQIVR